MGLRHDLATASPEWRPRAASKQNKLYNKELELKLEYLEQVFSVRERDPDQEEELPEPAATGPVTAPADTTAAPVSAPR
ncbi:MAG: hypothetical protein IPH86_11945 [bacterium]|nr:hypothetical protein [bacterium]